MSFVHFTSDTGEHTVAVTRVTQTLWHAVENDQVVGRGEASRRPDGRLFLSADAWHDAVFDQLADAMLAALPRPLHTIVDEADPDLTAGWARAGFTTRRREWEYLVPTDPQVTGLHAVHPPAGVTIIPAAEGPLRALDRVIRDEVEASVGWREMPTEVLPRSALDPTRCTVAAQADQYVGLVRLAGRPQQPRIGLIAVRAGQQRRGVGRALLAHVLGSLHSAGVPTASAEVTESNSAATALFDGVGARRVSSNLELVFA
jgi:ribosomal protein S18 acetylase RimI-like enzyme